MTTATNNNSLLLNGQTYDYYFNMISVALSNNPDFSNQFPEDFGTSLISFMASMATSMDYFTTRKLQEAYIETAQSPLGVYTGALSITGTLASSNPSTATVSYMLNTFSQEANGQILYNLPPNSIFTINNNTFYNPTEIVLDSSVATSGVFTLVEGTVNSVTYTSTGASYQDFFVSQNFVSGPNLVVVAMDPTTNTYSQWTYVDSLITSGSTVASNSTTGVLVNTPLNVYEASVYPDGSIKIAFGDGVAGNVPVANSSILINYYTCTGGSLNQTFTPPNYPAAVLTSSPVLGSTNITLFNQLVTTQVYSISGGSPSPSYLTYKQLSPKTYSSKGRNVGTNDFKANLINFYFAQSNSRPIVDCNIYTENIINNTLLSNTVVPVLLMDQLLYQSSSFISALSNYLTENSIPCTIVPVLAEIIPFSCIVSVNYIDTSLSTTTIYNNIVTAIQTLIPIGASTIVNGEVYWDITKATPGALGSTLYLSDFYDVITPVIGGNRFTISYHFKGSENIVSVASNQAIGLDFTQVLLGVTPVIVEYTYD